MIDFHVSTAPLQQYLTRFAATEDFEQTMARVFGSRINSQQLSKLQQEWSSDNVVLPPIEVLASADINGAQGAFAIATGKIYLAQEFLETSLIEAVTSVLLEEYGHFLDAQFNTVDTAGDEGALFSRLVQGYSLSAAEISSLQAEDDRALVTINGQQLWIEQANVDGNDNDNNLDGTAGADVIRGFAGRDTLSGLDGADRLIGGLGNDSLTGGNGNDTIVLENFNSGIFTNDLDVVTDFVQGQDKIDLTGLGISDFSTLLAITSNNASNSAVITTRNNGYTTDYGYSLQLTGVNFNALIASDFIFSTTASNATLTGGANSDDLFGGLGNDTLQGGGSSDRLFGEQGNDRLIGGTSSDTLVGGTGNDVIVMESFNGSIFANDLDIVNGFVQGQDKIDLTSLGISDFSTLLAITSNNASNSAVSTTRNNGYTTDYGYSLQLTGLNLNALTTSDFIFSTAALSETLTGGANSDDLFGGLGNDTLQGGGGDDRLFGEQGNDRLIGGAGNDTFIGGTGNDVIVLENFNGGIFANDLDIVTGFVQSQDKIDLTGLGISDFSTLLALTRNDASNNAVITTRNNGYTTDYGYSLQLTGLNLNALTAADFIFSTNVFNETFTGGANSDDLFGGLGNDTLQGGGGNDRLFGEQGNDRLIGGTGSDTFIGGTGNDVIVLENFNGGIFANDLDIVTGFVQGQNKIDLTGLGISDFSTLLALTRNDASNNAVITTRNNGYTTDYGYSLQLTGLNLNALTAADFIFSTNVFNETLTGGANSDDLFGGLGNDTLQGGGGTDRLFGEQGNDRLIGGIGSDTFIGGTGNDVIVLENFNGGIFANDLDIVTGFVQGQDKIDLTGLGISDFSTLLALTRNDASNNAVITTRNNGYTTDYGYSLQLTGLNLNALTAADFIFSTNAFNENLSGGSNSDDLFGGLGNDTLQGGAGDDRLFGEQGIDSLVGGTGRDSYYVTNIGDVVDETSTLANEIDHVYASISYQLGNNLENLTLTGTAAVNGTGNTANNIITGNSAANILTGDTGIDTLVGGLGNDTYIIDTTTDTITEAANEGIDTVQSSVTLSLTALANIENLTLTGAAAISATGNGGNNILTGNSGANTLTGGLGNDTYVVDTSDTIVEAANEGIDTVQSSGTFSLAALANLEHLTLTGAAAINGTGNASNNILTGNGAANILNGGAGIDTLVGGLGNDIYIIDTTTDTITEAASAGIDTVQSSVTFSLAPFANLENITLTGAAVINGTGNASSNILTGNSAANILDGGTGIDILVGGLGNDTYIVDTTTDTITEAASAGTDTVQSSVTFSLAPLANLENITLTGAAVINGTGNASSNILTGNSAANILDGGTGIDTLVGGLGNDTYIVDVATDVITEAANAGIDTVQSSATFSLASLINLEHLTLTGAAAINATGNASNNILTGNSAANILNGGTGNDTLIGGLGNDTYIVDVATDVITEAASAGTDTVQSSATFNLASLVNLEHLTLTGTAAINATGNASNNILTGNSAANILNGGTGNDSLVGGLGNDIYIVDAADIVTEGANAGIDTVQSSVTFSLAALINIENLTLTGAAINGTGNALNNTIYGNGLNNTLDGADGNDLLRDNLGNDSLVGGNGNDNLYAGIGNDTLVGGAGDDIYYLSYTAADASNDLVIEAAGGGIDTAYAIFSVTSLANEVEKLTLVGTGAIDGTGNASNNTIIGNGAANRLNGGAGTDTLQGGLGNDTFVFGFGESGVGTGVDRILDFAIGSDKIDLFNAPIPNNFARATNSTATTLAAMIGGVYADPTITLAGGGAALVVSTGVGTAGTYLVIDNGTAGFQAGSDLVVNITGFTGTLPGVGAITPNTFFV